MKEALPKTCQALRERLPDYAEGRLSGPAAAAVEMHLAACPRCREEVADLRAMLQALHAVPEATLPEGLVGEVTRTIIRRAPHRVAPPRWSQITIPAAAVTGVLVLLLVWHSQEPGAVKGAGVRPAEKSVGAAMDRQRAAPMIPAPRERMPAVAAPALPPPPPRADGRSREGRDFATVAAHGPATRAQV